MIKFWDQTLRDGEQSPGVFFTPNEKLRLAVELEKTGIFRAEVGFPVISRQELRAVKNIVDQGLKMKIVCPARCRREDIDAVTETGASEIAVFISTSPVLMKYSLRLTPIQVVQRLVQSVEYAVERGLYVHAVSEDSTRSNTGFVLRVLKESVNAGAKGIVITDTLGVATPGKMFKLARLFRKKVRTESYSIHAHDDLGLATANTLAAVEAGFDSPQTTINGIGERSGNASFEEVAMCLELLYRKKTSIRTQNIYRLARLVEKISGIPIPVHKPVIGTDSFVHEAGVHVAAVLRNPSTYEAFPPERVGRERRFSLGKHSGTAIVHSIAPKASEETVSKLTRKLKAYRENTSKKKLRRLIALKQGLDRERGGVTKAQFRRLVSISS